MVEVRHRPSITNMTEAKDTTSRHLYRCVGLFSIAQLLWYEARSQYIYIAMAYV